MSKTAPIIPCPTCQKPVAMTEQFSDRPFCSRRCKLIDLGEWATESHRIPGSHNDEDEHWSEEQYNDDY